MTYSKRLNITLPAALADIAAAIGWALDPDRGGDKSFSRDITGYSGEGFDITPIYGETISCTTPCSPEFKAQAEYMMLHPEALHAAVSSDYATRWPDLKAPTLADCKAFCAAIIQPELVPK